MFTRELPDVDRRNKLFWEGYDKVMKAARAVTEQRGEEYNRFCSVVDYYPKGVSEASLWPLHTKCLRLEQIVRGIEARGGLSDHDQPDALETVRDLINYASHVYGLIVSEQEEEIPF